MSADLLLAGWPTICMKMLDEMLQNTYHLRHCGRNHDCPQAVSAAYK